uniref:Uncharacterized protein n=1 Tax=Arundo donax TaxID=35708 RepID=A0A0A8ZY95_ARUDO
MLCNGKDRQEQTITNNIGITMTRILQVNCRLVGKAHVPQDI